jgi:hypothetical protein
MTRIWAGTIGCPSAKPELSTAPRIVPERNAGGGAMASSFLIVMSIWLGINILFVAVRLWVTRPGSRRVDDAPSQFSMKSRLHRHA